MDYHNMTRKQLVELAKELNIYKGNSKLKKD